MHYREHVVKKYFYGGGRPVVLVQYKLSNDFKDQ